MKHLKVKKNITNFCKKFCESPPWALMQCDRNFLSVVSVSQVFGVSKYKSENDRNWYFCTHKSFAKVNENNCETKYYQK